MNKYILTVLAVFSLTFPSYGSKAEEKILDGLQAEKAKYNGIYNFDTQVARIKDLKAKGIKVGLIIGRGNAEKKQKKSEPIPTNYTWVYANIAEAAFAAALAIFAMTARKRKNFLPYPSLSPMIGVGTKNQFSEQVALLSPEHYT